MKCDIKILNNEGLITSEYHFDYGGYYEGKTLFIYNDSNKLIQETYKDANDSISGKATLNYSKNGQFVIKTYNSAEDYSGERSEIVTDSNKTIKSIRKFNKNDMVSETRWEIIIDSNIRKSIFFSDSFPQGYVDKITTFDEKHREIKISEFNSKGIEKERIEKIYYRNGNLKFIAYYDENNNCICNNVFRYDKQNNCDLVTIKFFDKKTSKYKKIKYKQLITYYDKTKRK